MSRVLLSAMLLLLAGCASVPSAPESTWYRLPEPAPRERMESAPIPLPIVVETFLADGLYSDQALIYTLDAAGDRLRAYHYQLWIDPPVRLLQRRLIADLRAAGLSQVVTDRLPTRLDTLRVQGRIARLDRVKTEQGWEVAVNLVLRAEPSSGGRPWVIGEYSRKIPVTGERVVDSVRAYGQALDQIHGEFIDDLAAHARRIAEGDDALRMR